MYCLFFLFASFFLCEVSAEREPIEKIIKDYFNSESLQRFRKEWESHRKPIEHAMLTALKETVGVPGMNVYINKKKEKLAAGYFHTDNQVRVILSELDLEDEPRYLLPDVQLSLASNVLKIQTYLTKMIIHADYTLIRNKSDIIYEPTGKNTLKTSPFLFEQVQEVGKVAITMESCTLSGFIMTILNGESVNLGYDHFKLYNCTYSLEIYRPGEDSPPVIAPYELYRGDGLGLTHLLMKPLLTEELVPKLQAAMFSYVNTSALFGKALQQYRENQEVVFQATGEYFTELIRKLNMITVEKNHGAIAMEDYDIFWDDGRIKPSEKNQNSSGESMTLMNMVLTGLDTMYSAHCGGPFKIESVLMADEIRFSSLQVRGKIRVHSKWSDTFSFAVEINDMAVDLQMGDLQTKRNNKKSKRDSTGFKRFEVKGLRRMIFAVPKRIYGEGLITGYLSNEVPKLLRSHLSAIFSEAISKDSRIKVPVTKDQPYSADSEKNLDDDDSAETDPKSESNLDDDDSAKTDPKSESNLDDDDSAETLGIFSFGSPKSESNLDDDDSAETLGIFSFGSPKSESNLDDDDSAKTDPKSESNLDDDDSAKTDPKSESNLDDDDSAKTDPKSESNLDDDDSAETLGIFSFGSPKSESMPLTDSEDVNYRDIKGKRDRDIFKKNKKRFKSFNRPRRLRRYGSHKRVADNQIRKK